MRYPIGGSAGGSQSPGVSWASRGVGPPTASPGRRGCRAGVHDRGVTTLGVNFFRQNAESYGHGQAGDHDGATCSAGRAGAGRRSSVSTKIFLGWRDAQREGAPQSQARSIEGLPRGPSALCSSTHVRSRVSAIRPDPERRRSTETVRAGGHPGPGRGKVLFYWGTSELERRGGAARRAPVSRPTMAAHPRRRWSRQPQL